MYERLSNVDAEVVWFTVSMLALAIIGVSEIQSSLKSPNRSGEES